MQESDLHSFLSVLFRIWRLNLSFISLHQQEPFGKRNYLYRTASGKHDCLGLIARDDEHLLQLIPFGQLLKRLKLSRPRIGIPHRPACLYGKPVFRQIEITFHVQPVERTPIAILALELKRARILQKRTLGIRQENVQESVVDEIVLPARPYRLLLFTDSK